MKSTNQFKYLKILALFSLTLTLFYVSCSKSSSTTAPPATSKVALQSAIDSGNYYNANTTEGTKPGQYTVGAKATLNTAIASATAILNDATSTQTVLDNATTNMKAAIAAYHAAYIQQIAAANLIAYWKMNGNANDSSGNGHNGTVTMGHAFFGAGTPALTADRFGNTNMAYHFDNGGNIEVPYSASLNPSSISISLWVRMDTATRTINNANRYMIAMNRWNGWKFQTQPSLPFFTVHAIESGPPVDTTYYDRDDAGTALTSSTTWYHLVVTFKPGEEDFYINGSLVKSWTNVPGTPISAASNPINITIGSDLPTNKYLTVDATGNFLVDYGGFWSGDMDDVMFYNIALTGPQVQSIYNDQKTQ
jgi:Concanavalin A-like lectin/glucanases superfamily